MANSSSTPKISVSPLAQLKLLSHAAKHPSQSCLGLLVGPSSEAERIEVTDALPVLHNYANSAVVVQLALELADKYLENQARTASAKPSFSTSDAEKKGKAGGGKLEIVGVYAAPSHVDQTELSSQTREVVKAVAAKREGRGAVALLISGASLTAFLSSTISKPLAPFTIHHLPTPASSPTLLPPTSTPTTSTSLTPAQLRAALSASVHAGIADLDDHLEDPGRDWLANAAVEEAWEWVRAVGDKPSQ